MGPTGVPGLTTTLVPKTSIAAPSVGASKLADDIRMQDADTGETTTSDMDMTPPETEGAKGTEDGEDMTEFFKKLAAEE
jgi:hypothetical protein